MYLVGAGPGDPGLLTLRGAECLRAADVVLYDYLASPELLGRHAAGRRAGLPRPPRPRPADVAGGNQRANDPRTPARAEPSCGSRAATRRSSPGSPRSSPRSRRPACRTKSCPASPPPKPPAATPAFRSPIATTPRASRSSPARNAATNAADESLDYAALAQFPGTLVFYMGLTTAPQWSRALIAHGKIAGHAGGHRPPLHVRRSANDFHDARRRRANTWRLGKLRPPAVVIVGDVARERDGRQIGSRRGRCSVRPCSSRGRNTRPTPWCSKLRASGCQRALPAGDRNRRAARLAPVDAVIDRLADFDWLVFSSSNGVDYFLRRLLELGHDLRALGGGEAGRDRPGHGRRTRRVPSEGRRCSRTRTAPKRWPKRSPRMRRGKRFFLARASRGREVLAEMLTAAGGDRHASRRLRKPRRRPTRIADVLEALTAGRIDWTTVTSSAIARSLVAHVRRRPPQHEARRHQPAHGRGARRTGPRAGRRRRILHDRRHHRRDPGRRKESIVAIVAAADRIKLIDAGSGTDGSEGRDSRRDIPSWQIKSALRSKWTTPMHGTAEFILRSRILSRTAGACRRSARGAGRSVASGRRSGGRRVGSRLCRSVSGRSFRGRVRRT